MTVDEAKILLADLNRGYKSPYSTSEQVVIEKLYYEVLGKSIRGCRCPDKWRDAVIEIYSYIKKHGKMKEKSNYKLRAGVILQIAGSSEIYTNDNLTDEVAAAFLKEHPNAAGRFEIIPSAKKETTASKAGGRSSELEAANARIAVLESEKAELESRCAALQAKIDAANEIADDEDAAGSEEQPAGDAPGTIKEGKADETAPANPEAATDDAIRKAIAAELVAGKSKSAIKSALAGKEIGGVKLTHRLVADCIDKITAEE